MLVGTPIRESAEVVEYLERVGVEDVRPVFVHEDAAIVVMIIGVARDVRPLVYDQHLLVGVVCQSLR